MYLSRQEIFNRAVAGLASQGFERSVGKKTFSCAYRGEGGLKCAAGHIIDDSVYDPFETWVDVVIAIVVVGGAGAWLALLLIAACDRARARAP